MAGRATGGGLERFRAPSRKLVVLRTGFVVLLGLLVFCTYQAWRIQDALSRQTAEIYRRHTMQDDLLYRVRRTLWLGSNAARDYLLSPHADRQARLVDQLSRYRQESNELLDQIDRMTAPESRPKLPRSTIDEFWTALESTPEQTKELTRAQQYEYVQREIVPRRSGVGDLVREFVELSRQAIEESEAEFAETRKNAANRLLVIVALTLASGVLVSLYSLVHTEELARRSLSQYRQVQQASAELSQLSARLMEVQEEERTRLARELHDEIGQALATLRLEIARVESAMSAMPDAADRLQRAGGLVEKTMRTVRNTSLLLRPSLLDDLGLGAALQWLAEDFSRRTGVPCDYHDDGLAGALPESLRTCVYRVVQESLHNIDKHAAATRVSVRVGLADGELTLAVEDNGKGFDVDTQGGPHGAAHFGILGMRERAAALGGRVELQSSPGGGTRLRLSLPRTDVEEAEAKPAAREVTA